MTGSQKYETLGLQGSSSAVNSKLVALTKIHGELDIVRRERNSWDGR